MAYIHPQASTAYVTKYIKGVGRHEKCGVRIGVGRIGESTIIALPGPNYEVHLCLKSVINGIKENIDKDFLAERIASKLRERLRNEVRVME